MGGGGGGRRRNDPPYQTTTNNTWQSPDQHEGLKPSPSHHVKVDCLLPPQRRPRAPPLRQLNPPFPLSLPSSPLYSSSSPFSPLLSLCPLSLLLFPSSHHDPHFPLPISSSGSSSSPFSSLLHHPPPFHSPPYNTSPFGSAMSISSALSFEAVRKRRRMSSRKRWGRMLVFLCTATVGEGRG